jgi:hypothetical protein
MLVSDNSDEEAHNYDVDELIEEALSGGSKTPDELFKAVMKKTAVNERTYYRHLEKLVDQSVVEEVSEKGEIGRIVKKYSMRASLLKEGSSDLEDVPLSRRLLEIAAWLKLEPDGWPQFEAVRKAKVLEKNCRHIVPSIEPSREDPDCFAFAWSDEPCGGQRHGEFVQSRFFKSKDVYGAVVQAGESRSPMGCRDVFVGAYGSDVVAERVMAFGNMVTQIQLKCMPMELVVDDEPFSVCVAVCRETNGVLRVVHVEGSEGELDKAWIRGISKQLNAKIERMLTFSTIKENVKRDVLTKLRDVLEKHALAIPNRYVKLVEELLDFSYGKPSSGYVLALALAVETVCRLSRSQVDV